MTINKNGAVLWEGPSPVDGSPIVLIITGLAGKASANRKTGEMLQTWILRQDMDPVVALMSGHDRAICGDCPMRGDHSKARACYVNVGQAPKSVYRCYARGGYAHVSPAEMGERIAGQAVRLGAYGDPGLVPLSVLQDLTRHARLWTGYTHQWRTITSAYSDLLMASAETVADRRKARVLGYRVFQVVPRGTNLRDVKAMECASTRERNPLHCADCGACAGTRNGATPNAVDVVIIAHGTGAKYVPAL